MKTVEQMIADFQPAPEVVEGYEKLQQLSRERDRYPELVGVSASRGRIRDWRQAPVQNGQIVKNPQTEVVDWGLEPLRKRTPAERLADVTDMLVAETMKAFRAAGNRMYDAAGRCVIPRSVLRDIQQEMWKQGTPVAIEDLQRFTEEQITPMLERYAAAVLTRCERKYEGNKPSYRTDVATGRVAV